MELRYLKMILKPYYESGIRYTSYYKPYGLYKAALIIGDEIKSAAEIMERGSVSDVVLIDCYDLSRIRNVKKLCIIFTERSDKSVDFSSIYNSEIETLIVCGEYARFTDKIRIDKIPHLTHLKAPDSLIDKNLYGGELCSLELSDINKCDDLLYLKNFAHLKSLTLTGGIVVRLTGLNTVNNLECFTMRKVEIIDCFALRELISLKSLSICGRFNPNIVSELSHLKNLEYVKLDGYIDIDNILWVRDLSKLKVLILGCVIRNGDLSLLRKIPYVRLKTDMDYYNLHDRDLSKIVCRG